MAALQTVWSIDVGKSSLKAVKLHRERNHLEILAVDKVDYVVDTDGIDDVHQAREAIQTFASRNQINAPVIVAHPGHSAFSRFIQLPPVDDKKLVEMVGYEAQQQIPFPIDEVMWDYHVCDTGETGAEKEVGIFAVRSEAVYDFMADYESSGVPINQISIGYLGLLNHLLYDVRPQKPCVVIDIGSDHTDLLIIDGKRFWIRNLAIAGNDVTRALTEKFNINFSEAERLKTQASKTDQAVKIFNVIQPTLKDLVNEVHRSVGFYKSQAGDVKFEDVFLFGNGARLIGIQKYLQEHLRFRVHVEKGFHRIRVNRDSNVALLQQDFLSFAPAVGNAIQALGAGECDVNLLPKEQQEAIEFRSKQKLVLFAVACTYLVIAFMWFTYGQRATKAESALNETKIAKQWKGNEKKIKNLESDKKDMAKLENELVDQSKDRLLPHEGLKLLAQAVNTLPNAEFYQGEHKTQDWEDDPEGILDAQDTLNANKIWITGVDVQRVKLGAKGLVLDKPGKEQWVPGYSFRVVGKTPARDGEENDKDVRARLHSKLEAAVAKQFGKPSGRNQWVVLGPSPDDKNPGFILSQPKRYPSSAGRLEREDGERSATGTYYEFELKWVLHRFDLPGEKGSES